MVVLPFQKTLSLLPAPQVSALAPEHAMLQSVEVACVAPPCKTSPQSDGGQSYCLQHNVKTALTALISILDTSIVVARLRTKGNAGLLGHASAVDIGRTPQSTNAISVVCITSLRSPT